ncbi:SDR family NAD(P)-dependent oxidoreductase [Nocardioides sp. Arc9.136]|uniref:SDR family NAD(P)-dependent oxidoreductase n=1 Tax=Nocardioides sp. Arc9.136 TaxID=2996826 RepID=UPI002666BDC5|nr:SDR family oxidoreductase [Nocardioides sp. Arc9.136]WKN48764.1 SDR family oxidoreductase [Nocardioides sp. Arc9.136]
MADRLQDRTAIVTGGANGIGRGIVRAFVAEGARVMAVDVDEERGEQLAAELGDAVRFLAVDISQEASAEVVRDAALAAWGSVHVLVNNAHASRQAPFVETTMEMFALSFDTGFYPAFWLMRACYPDLRATRGSVINFASGAGLVGHPTQLSYAAAKEAVRAMSRVAAHEWAEDDINVNVISPLARTEGVDRFLAEHPEREAALLRGAPLGRLGDPEADIGRAAVFLASDDASYITGQTLMVDGGGVMLR